MEIAMCRKSFKVGATGIVPCGTGCKVMGIGLIGSIARLFVLLVKSKIASVLLNRKRQKDTANYYFRRIEEISFEIMI